MKNETEKHCGLSSYCPSIFGLSNHLCPRRQIKIFLGPGISLGQKTQHLLLYCFVCCFLCSLSAQHRQTYDSAMKKKIKWFLNLKDEAHSSLL